ncbi:hypothetical protein NDU88_001024 [Pleurodeles waltl]|uniref:Integrase catalytic domain-containing protein n=1 Tax=Pleurodeles waltl TaxID=8319 RepID=A0AAV7TGP2_PLEWA|nr:hypothetical protein NDU88_001024 [Pleurodeles waltl]
MVQQTSENVEECVRTRGIKHKKLALYHPETNGVVEHFIKVLKESLEQSLVFSVAWESKMRKKVQEYPLTPHSSLSVSPFQLFKGRLPSSETVPRWVNGKRKGEDDSAGNVDMSKEKEKEEMVRRKELYDEQKAVKKTLWK